MYLCDEIIKFMRKASRQMDATFALEVFDKAPYVTVSMTRPDGSPYGYDKEGEELKYGRMELLHGRPEVD